MIILNQTAGYIQLGPFVDSTDGVTPETSLAGTMTVYISKENGAYGARNSATAIAHDRVGHYRVHLDTTDRDTTGILTVNVSNSTVHMDVTKEYLIVTNGARANYLTGMLDADIQEVTGTSVTDVDDFKAVGAGLTFDYTSDLVTLAAATHTGAVIPTVTDLTNTVTIGAMNAAGAQDFMTVDSGETVGAAGSVAKIAQGAAGGNVTVEDFTTAGLAKLSNADSGETTPVSGSVTKLAQGAAGGNVTVEDLTQAALAKFASTDTGETTAVTGSVCNLADTNNAAGAGSETVVVTVTDALSNPIDGAEVYVTTDAAGTNTIAGTLTTNASGQVTFYLDVGTYYVWLKKSGYNFTNPNELTVTS